MTETQALAAAILQSIGPDPFAHDHLKALRRAIGLHCAIQGCDNDHRSSGFCLNHYKLHFRAMANESHTINRKAVG